MKSPEEIKRALEYCNMLTNRKNICESCPYNGECTETGKPDQPGWDALLYIQQLEETIDLMKRQMHGDCGVCKYRDIFDGTCKACCEDEWEYKPKWEYEGLPLEDTNHEKPV